MTKPETTIQVLKLIGGIVIVYLLWIIANK